MDNYLINFIIGIILSPWVVVFFLKGIMRAWDEIDSLKRYLRG